MTSITWSPDSKYFLTTSKDMSARVYSANPTEGFTPFTLSGHRDSVVGAWWSKEQDTIYTISKDGALFEWRHQLINPKDAEESDDENSMDIDQGARRWSAVQRHFFFQDHAKVVCAAYHAASAMIVVGFSNGVFGIWELPSFTNIHTLR